MTTTRSNIMHTRISRGFGVEGLEATPNPGWANPTPFKHGGKKDSGSRPELARSRSRISGRQTGAVPVWTRPEKKRNKACEKSHRSCEAACDVY